MTDTEWFYIVNLMVNNNTDTLNLVFSALADPTRREMLGRLSGRTMSVKELSEPFSMSKPAITKHLKVLERAGLLARDKVGRVHHCNLDSRPLRQVADWVSHYERFWIDKLDSLEAFLDNEEDKDG